MRSKSRLQTNHGAVFLQLSDVTLRVADGEVFRGTNWTWERGQHWALMGPNGSGKSLLARAVAGQIPIIGGTLHYGFSPPTGRSHEDAIALVSFEQSHEIGLNGPPATRWFSLEHLDMPSVLEFLSRERIEEINPFEVGGPPRRSPGVFERDRKHVLKLLRIEALVDRDMLALSNGERRKVLIARALLKRPKLLILDEPFSGLDAASRAHFRQVITELMRTGNMQILLVTMRPDELPTGITHQLYVDHHHVMSVVRQQKRLAPTMANGRLRAVHVEAKRVTRSAESGTTPEPIIRMSHVTVSYGEKAILRDFSWTVSCGESWAILGPNGSGKTTLLSLITGDNPQAYANDVVVFGKRRGEEESLWELKRRIGVVSPDELLSCDGSLTCEDLVCPGWDDPDLEQPTRQQRQSAKRWLRTLGMSWAARELFGRLPLGEQQIVLLARALAKEPGILVLDEPCQGLDAAHRRHFIRSVEAVMKQGGLTVLYVTHHRDEIPRGIVRTLNLPSDISKNL